ncbi:type II secretion system F family protein [Candidatus Giovannonibacteria bacterium]|nr:type II secretion system F family protein [Candidatus Giovannonibacteria bacterium]
MPQFSYKARTSEGEETHGVVDAATVDLAVSSLQRKNFLVTEIEPMDEPVGLGKAVKALNPFERVKQEDVVIISRQLSTLFEAKVPVVESMKIIVNETQKGVLRKHFIGLLDDIQGGLSMSQAMDRHPEVFSKFYVAMVRSGEESGRLEEVFKYLADYLEHSYELTSKAKNALIYPVFVLLAFVGVIVLMMTTVIPRLSTILTEAGQELPFYTKVVIGMSNFLRNFGVILLILLAVGVVMAVQYSRTKAGKEYFSRLLLAIPVIGGLFRKIYLARISDNLHTLLSGGITVVRSLEISADVVGNEVYRKILLEAMEGVRGGSTISDAFARYEDIPPLFTQMVKVGEEAGRLENILNSLSGFYMRDVDNLISNLVSLIEPMLIVGLGLGVGFLVASVLLPIYNLASAF